MFFIYKYLLVSNHWTSPIQHPDRYLARMSHEVPIASLTRGGTGGRGYKAHGGGTRSHT